MTGSAALDPLLDAFLADFYRSFGPVPPATALMRLVAAALLGGLIGFDRQIQDKPAGLRTHMLIALAAALFALIGRDLVEFVPASPALRVDPLRLIEAVTAGVAFLAAGSIITSRGAVHGITTGAGMWMAGAIGLACGIGRPALAAMATLLALVVLTLLRALERWMK